MNRGDGTEQPPSTDTGEPAPIFLSYAREDRKQAVRIINALEKCGIAVWWDGLLDSGARFSEQTQQALDAAPAVVVLWSAASVTSHWVHDEAGSGRDRGCLVPISIDASPPPIGFRQFQVIDLSKWRGSRSDPEFIRVLRGIAALTQPGSAPAAGLAVLPAAAPHVSRRTLMLGGAVAVAAGGVGAWQLGWLDGGAMERSIAVLPFDNDSGDDSKDYFAQGLSAELRAQLSRNTALRVAAQASSEAVARGGDSAVTMARKLGVAYLLDGNVRWAGDAVRIAVDLIDRATGSNRWGKVFDLRMGDIFAVQSEIAGAVTAALAAELGDEADRSDLGGTTNAVAYDQYLRGRDLYAHAASEEMDRAALARFDAAIAADPDFAAAHSARALSLTIIGGLYGDLAETRSLYAAALASARRAVAIAPRRAESQSTLGYVLSQAHLNAQAAREPFERSRALGAGDASVLARYAEFAGLSGRFDEADAAVDRAVVLDPLNPNIMRMRGRILLWKRRYTDALVPLRTALEMGPQSGFAHAAVGHALLLSGQLAEARDAYLRETLPIYKQTGLAIVNHRLGRLAEAAAARQQIIDGLGNDQVTFYQQAQIAAQWGDVAAAMQALADARAAADLGLSELKVDPFLDPLRQRPDFASLRTALHFD